jgi:hypothetical protein
MFTSDCALASRHLLCSRAHPQSFLRSVDSRPLPLVTDLDGDGLNEIVVCTRDAKLRVLSAPNATSASLRASQSNMCVLSPSPLSIGHSRTQPLRVDGCGRPIDLSKHIKAETPLYAMNLQSGRQPVSIAAGFLDNGKTQVGCTVCSRGRDRLVLALLGAGSGSAYGRVDCTVLRPPAQAAVGVQPRGPRRDGHGPS